MSLSRIPVIIPVLFMWFACTVTPRAALAFTITEPPEESVHQPGQLITTKLNFEGVRGVTKVKYYWYGEFEDMLQELVEEKLALVSTSTNTPAFGGSMVVPHEAIGRYRLLADAELGGRQSEVKSLAIFDEVFIQIQPQAELEEIDFQTDKPLRLGRAGMARVYDQVDFLGTIYELPVIGRFSDGVTRPIRSQAAGTAYTSSDESVITVNADGVLRLTGNGETVLTVTNRNQKATLTVIVEVDDEPNQPPVSDPGRTQVVTTGERVTLNGLASYDPEGGSLLYYWSQVGGSKIPLLDPYSAQARFLAPFVVEERTFRFKLKVTDIRGADSDPAFVDVIIQP